MNLKFFRFAVSLVFLAGLAQRSSALNPSEIAALATRSVVVIETKDRAGNGIGLGTGFFVQKGVVASNLHVFEGAVTATVRLVNQRREYAVEGFLAADAANDVILLKVAARMVPSLNLEMKGSAEVGDDVFVMGNPRGLEGTFSRGIVSARRDVKGKPILQITAPISPGSSGGPVLSSEGAVVGVAVAYIQDGQNLNFAVPARIIAALVTRLRPVASLSRLPVLASDTKIGPDDIYAAGSLRLGRTLITLGMPINDAISRLQTFYRVTGGPQTYTVLEREDGEFSIIGSVSQVKGKVVAVQHEIERIGEQEPATALVKELYALCHRISENSDGLCAIKTTHGSATFTYGRAEIYTITFSFGDYEIAITTDEASGNISSGISLTEGVYK